MFTRILFWFCVPFVILASTCAAADQGQPWQMTGKVFVEGRPVGTGFLVGDAVVLTCNHLIYNPNQGYSDRHARIEFAPGANGTNLPYGKFRSLATTGDEGFYAVATSLDGDGYVRRAQTDWLLLLLDRSPGVGHFNVATTVPFGNEERDMVWQCGYPASHGGGMQQEMLHLFNQDDGIRLQSYGGRHADIKGYSGAPFFNQRKGKWVVCGIHLGYGNDTGFWMHLRITPEIKRTIERCREMPREHILASRRW